MKLRTFVSVFILLIPTLAYAVQRELLTRLPEPEPAPDFTLQDTQGNTHRLSDYRGKVVILNFWATWCRPCRKEMPSMQRAWEEVHDQGVVLLAVNWQEDKETIAVFEVGNLLNALTQIQASPGEELHRHGDQADSLYLAWEGSLLLSMEFDGREIPLGALGPGQHIGSVAVIEPGPAPTTMTVAEPSTLLRMDHSGLNALRANHPRLGGHLVQALSLDLTERLRFYEEGMAGRNQPPRDPDEFARLCRPLMGIKTG